MPPNPESTVEDEPAVPATVSQFSAAGAPAFGLTWLRVLSGLAIGLLLLLSAGLLVTQREAALDRAKAQAQREVKRLAAELEQSLRAARASLDVVHHAQELASSDLLGDHRPLVGSLNLPFELGKRDPAEAGVLDLPAGQWLPGLSREESGRRYLPLIWREAPERGGQAYEVLLSVSALRARFASEGMPAGGSMVLFRVEDSGATTVLVRHPQVQDDGRTVHGHVADALKQAPSGVVQVVAVIDGVPRIVGYQRLAQGAERLVLTYALPVAGVLAAWTAVLPLAIALTLLVAGAMAYGAWRLDRSVRDLSSSERHYQTLASHLPDVIVRCDRQGRALYANPAIEGAIGVRPEDMIGKTMAESGVPGPVADLWSACLQRVFASRQAETLNLAYPGPRGTRHWEALFHYEWPQSGDLPTILVITRDSTERHEAEARRQSAQALFESVFQAAPEAMSLGDWDSGRLLLVNDAFCRLFGRPREQLIGATSTALGLWHRSDRRQRLLAALEKGEQARDATGVVVDPDGQEIHVRYSAERVTVDGQPRLLLIIRDVTQLELDQRALARSEQRFRLAAAHGQVWEWDSGSGFIEPSDQFFVALGHPAPPAAQMGPALLGLVHPEDLPRLRLALRRYFKGEADYRLEFRARDAQGRYHWFDTRGSGLRDASGRVTHLSGTTFEITDGKLLEEAQRQTLNQLETVANASAALFWTTDANRRNDWVNRGWLEFTGRSLQADLDASWLEDLHPQDRERCTAIADQAFEAREAYVMEYRMRRHDGAYRWLLEQGKPRYDADNRFIGFIGSCLDMTDLRQAEAAAHQRGAVLEQVIDVLQDMLFLVDEQERFVHYQAGQHDGLYAQPEQFLGRTIGDVLPPHVVKLQREAMARARDHGPQEMDYSLELPAGLRHFNARLAWLPARGHCMFLVRDVTDQQVAHRERERLNQFVLLLFRLANRFINLPVQEADAAINEALGDMGRFVDADRAYLFDHAFDSATSSNTHEWCAEGVSPEIENLQNIPIERIPDLVSRHQRGQVVHVPDVQALPPGNLRDMLERQGIQSLIELPLMHGERCLGSVGLDSVRSTRDHGEEETTLLRLFAQMLVNIRLRVEAQEQIHELTEGLEHKVAERTAQLEDSLRQLKTVNRELESFTYSASHDLRTPLRGIEGFSSLLLQEHAEQLGGEGRAYLQRIQKATLQMSQLISDLLAYSRLQQLTEQIEPIALAVCVREVAAPFGDELEAREGQLSVLVPDDLLIQADAKGLAIVLRNLIGNALKFTPAGDAPRIRIEAQVRGDRVHLSVTDRGMGFDMKYHDRIFGMFQRLHRQDQIAGTGIGLAMVHKAVERMGGRIRAESAPGHGATFHIELPRA